MINVSSFNSIGIQAFSDLIDEQLSHNTSATVDMEFITSIVNLCYNKEYIKPLDHDCEIDENKIFQFRFDLGEYLHNQLSADSKEIVQKNIGLWTWISALYFKQLLEPKKNNEYILRSEYRYKIDIDPRRFYRHLIFTSFYIYRTRSKDVSRFFLSILPHISGDLIEQLYSRAEFFMQIPSLVEVALELYLDPKTHKHKTGLTVTGKPGGVKRLAGPVSQQLSMTYDISSMTKNEILDILPNEFDNWKN